MFYILMMALWRPERVGAGAAADNNPTADEDEVSGFAMFTSLFGIIAVVVAVLGGIWFGFFTPTEGAGVGAFIALILGLAKGMRGREIVDSILAVGRTSAPILLLLLTAALYSRVLAMTGVSSAIQDFFLASGLPPWQILAAMVLVWFVLGMVIDSISIMLLTVPIFAPLAASLGFDPIAFAIIGILAIEAGLLTPPFGLLVYTVKAAIQDDNVSIVQIFISSTPYWIIILLAMVAIARFPEIATFLPGTVY
jgi:TRAP-type C4-dicarboxylate transport system permease large subunit